MEQQSGFSPEPGLSRPAALSGKSLAGRAFPCLDDPPCCRTEPHFFGHVTAGGRLSPGSGQSQILEPRGKSGRATLSSRAGTEVCSGLVRFRRHSHAVPFLAAGQWKDCKVRVEGG